MFESYTQAQAQVHIATDSLAVDSFEKQKLIITESPERNCLLLKLDRRRKSAIHLKACAASVYTKFIEKLIHFHFTLFTSLIKIIIIHDWQIVKRATERIKYVEIRQIRRQRGTNSSNNNLFIKYTLTFNTCNDTQIHTRTHTIALIHMPTHIRPA